MSRVLGHRYLYCEKSILCWFGQYCEKKIGADYKQLWRPIFLCFHGQKTNLDFIENIVPSAMKICIESQNNLVKYFLRGKKQFF